MVFLCCFYCCCKQWTTNVTCHPWLMAPFLSLKRLNFISLWAFFSCCISISDPAWESSQLLSILLLGNQGDPGWCSHMRIFKLNNVCYVKYIHSQVPGPGVWTSLRDHYSVYHRSEHSTRLKQIWLYLKLIVIDIPAPMLASITYWLFIFMFIPFIQKIFKWSGTKTWHLQ